MRIRRSPPDLDAGTVEVRFSHAGVSHTRDVRLVRFPDGTLDQAATEDRIQQLADGIAVKIDAGAIQPVPKRR